MKKPVLLHALRVVFAVAVCAGYERAVLAQDYGCPPFVDPFVGIIPITAPERYDNNKSLQQIQAMAGQPNVISAGVRELPVGLTAASLRLDASFEVATRTVQGRSGACAQISNMELRFGLDDTTVYIAREIPFHSCGYETVLEHESRHLATDRWLIASYLPQLHDLLAGEIRRIGVVTAPTPEMAEERIRAAVNVYLQELGASMAAVREREQQKVDAPGEYQRLTMSCGGELSRLVSGRSPLQR